MVDDDENHIEYYPPFNRRWLGDREVGSHSQSKDQQRMEKANEFSSKASIRESMKRGIGIVSSMAERYEVMLNLLEQSLSVPIDMQKERRVVYVLKKACEHLNEILSGEDTTGEDNSR